MNKKKILDFLKTLLLVIVATFLFAIAVRCYVYADLGSDSVTVFQQGLHEFTGLSLGIAAYLYSISFLILDFFLCRKNIGWATLINCFFLGLCIDLVAPLFALLPPAESLGLPLRICFLAAGIFLVSLSCVMLIRTNKGKNVLDATAWGLSEKLKWPYRIVRILVDATLMLTGWLMGGVVFYGSIAAVLLTGPTIQFLNKAMDRIKRGREQTQEV